ncbi:spore coat protein [Domibacillus epiphyticus]|uniref:Spore coat protein n=1 Tax=Domibacillus epiphyticus TaxID=1714355 RepID=A0A1V2A5K2_9BACI|nr:spore coat protein [Domibacillus epiphyticus]OMP66142.1 spore coat protein [Domibacillus epiphyticus]
MNGLLKNITGMKGMTDEAIATDLLIAAKSGVKFTAFALTEAATPELRTVLREQLMAAITTHDNLSKYMMAKGFYHPYNFDEQIQVDATAAATAKNLTN